MKAIPWDMIAPHEAQAQENHQQSLATLARRCGLSPCEALAVIEDRPWAKDDGFAEVTLIQLSRRGRAFSG